MGTTTLTAEPGSHALEVTREFAATPELVFRCYNDPDLLAQWLGPRYLTMKVETFEPRFGGVYRFTHIAPDGGEHKFQGVYVNEPSIENGIVRTFEYLGTPNHFSLETMRLEKSAGGTIIYMGAVFQSVEDRDGHLEAGMEGGMNESMERLDELLATLA